MITVDWLNKIVNSTASILDLPAFKDTIRDLEDDAEGILYLPVISYKRLDLGGGAYFHAVDFINGYQLKFPNAGNYTIIGNLGATIIPVAGVYVERKTSAAFATSSTSGGGSAPTAEQIRQEIDNNSVKLNELHEISNLKAGVPVANSATYKRTANIEIVLANDGTEVVGTRQ